MSLESASKRAEIDKQKDEVAAVLRAATTSPEEKSAAIAEITRLEQEALRAEEEAGESTVLPFNEKPESEDHAPEVVTPVTEGEAEENRERIAEVQEGGKSEEEVLEDAAKAVKSQTKTKDEAKAVEDGTEEKAEKAASKSRSKNSK